MTFARLRPFLLQKKVFHKHWFLVRLVVGIQHSFWCFPIHNIEMAYTGDDPDESSTLDFARLSQVTRSRWKCLANRQDFVLKLPARGFYAPSDAHYSQIWGLCSIQCSKPVCGPLCVFKLLSRNPNPPFLSAILLPPCIALQGLDKADVVVLGI